MAYWCYDDFGALGVLDFVCYAVSIQALQFKFHASKGAMELFVDFWNGNTIRFWLFLLGMLCTVP